MTFRTATHLKYHTLYPVYNIRDIFKALGEALSTEAACLMVPDRWGMKILIIAIYELFELEKKEILHAELLYIACKIADSLSLIKKNEIVPRKTYSLTYSHSYHYYQSETMYDSDGSLIREKDDTPLDTFVSDMKNRLLRERNHKPIDRDNPYRPEDYL